MEPSPPAAQSLLDAIAAIAADPMLSEYEGEVDIAPRPTRPRRNFRAHRWHIAPDETRGSRATPVPPSGSHHSSFSSSSNGAVVSNFAGLRLLRKMRRERLDERRLLQHERMFDEEGAGIAGESHTGEWLKFLKGAAARSKAEGDKARKMLCQVLTPELAGHIANFICGDSFSEYGAATMDTDDVPKDDRDNVSGGDDDETSLNGFNIFDNQLDLFNAFMDGEIENDFVLLDFPGDMDGRLTFYMDGRPSLDSDDLL